MAARINSRPDLALRFAATSDPEAFAGLIEVAMGGRVTEITTIGVDGVRHVRRPADGAW